MVKGNRLAGGTALIVTSVTTTLGKIAIGRARPYGGLGHSTFRPLNGREEYMSFPSGYTTAAFALSAVLAERIKNPWASVGLYGVAAGAAVSRMYTRDHWLSDIVFTAAYSSVVARFLVHWFEDGEHPAEGAHSLNMIPTMQGVEVVWQW